MTTNNHEVIFEIINSGYADEAMAVAHESDACGGTIINARGVAGKEAAAFFGITFHEEKEILMLVVEKEHRDAVLNALYREMGMGKKARGIAFSLPVSDVTGLIKEKAPEDKEYS